jgi:ABC-type polysaccharide/polyol phosphate transport system ATPase subunit
LDENIITLSNIDKFFNFKTSSPQQEGSNLSENFIKALENISFSIKKGEVFSIIGSNGSGKTTLLRIIAGIIEPDNGSISVKGKLAPLLQLGVGFHPELIAKENIFLYGLLLGFKKNEILSKVDDIIAFAELQPFSSLKLKHYSTGMKLRLALSTAFQVNSDIILIDEVLAVGDIKFRKKSMDAFLSYKKKGKTIVFTTHNLHMLSISDRSLFINKGKIINIGNPREIAKEYEEFMNANNV